MNRSFLISLPVALILVFAGFWRPPNSSSDYDSAHWIESGLARERAGDLIGAERDLFRAAEFDRLFQPSWTLAGFYFRWGNDAQFWFWARRALAVGRRDLGALFDLCWQTGAGSTEIWNRTMPDRKQVWDEYLFYLMTSGRWAAAASVAGRIATVAEPADVPLLTNYTDLAIDHSDRSSAYAVWQSLCSRGLLQFRCSLLSNGNFRVPPSGHGFDWRAYPTFSVSASFRNSRARIDLGGNEPDLVTLLEQRLFLDQNKTYRLTFEYQGGHPGIHWEAGDSRSRELSSVELTRAEFEFPGSAESLSLVYSRPSGVSNADGPVSIRNVELLPK